MLVQTLVYSIQKSYHIIHDLNMNYTLILPHKINAYIHYTLRPIKGPTKWNELNDELKEIKLLNKFKKIN